VRGSRLLVLADVGGPAFHVGGEATLEANLQRLAASSQETAVRVLGWVPGERIFYQVDDAFGLAGVHPRDAVLERAADAPFIAVTLDPSFAAATLARLGAQLAAVAREAGLRVVVIPHVRPRDADGPVALLLADQLAGEGVEAMVVPMLPATEVVWLTQRAGAVVSSRPHPLVFGLAAGVPCLALHRDASTRSELQGALSHVGMRLWSVPVAELEVGGLTVKFRELWRHRDALRDVIRASLPILKRRDARRWHHVLTRLGIPPADVAASGPAPVGWPAEAMTLAKAFQARARLSDPSTSTARRELRGAGSGP
jgi:polysaccharide pyruvyl transferase WcaK-like protein